MHGDVGDDEAFMVQRQVTVDRLWEDAVAVIDEEDQKASDDGKNNELNARPNLHYLSAIWELVGAVTYDAAGHGGGTSGRAAAMILREEKEFARVVCLCSHDICASTQQQAQ